MDWWKECPGKRIYLCYKSRAGTSLNVLFRVCCALLAPLLSLPHRDPCETTSTVSLRLSWAEHFGEVLKDLYYTFKLGLSSSLPQLARVAEDIVYRSAIANSDKQNTRIEDDKAMEREMTNLPSDHTEMFTRFSDNDSFSRWLSEMVFATTYAGTRGTASRLEGDAGQAEMALYYNPTTTVSFAVDLGEGMAEP